jgi:hypothetical protein
MIVGNAARKRNATMGSSSRKIKGARCQYVGFPKRVEAFPRVGFGERVGRILCMDKAVWSKRIVIRPKNIELSTLQMNVKLNIIINSMPYNRVSSSRK